jgi:hypothetical protein
MSYAVPRPGRRGVTELWDGRFWPCAGFYAGAPVFRFRWAPSGLATVRQLAAEGLRPGGQEVAGWLAWGRGSWPRWAYLYRRDLAKPKRQPSEAQREALARATAARLSGRLCAGGHVFGPWWACGCGQGIADHHDGSDGLCGFEFRACWYCPAWEDRHVTDSPDAARLHETAHDAGRPGVSSAKTSHRAGSPNHQNDSKENHIVERPGTSVADERVGGVS